MGQWGAGIAISTEISPLERTVYKLSPKAKQAMYAAGRKQILRKGTWAGCAFNAAGCEIGKYINNFTKAAQVFEMNESDVERFIQIWDTCNQSTSDLISILLNVGLYSEPCEPPKSRPNRVEFHKFTSWETRMMEELDLNIEQDILSEGTEEAAKILVRV